MINLKRGLVSDTPRHNCRSCGAATFYEDRHGFDFGPAEVTRDCAVFDGPDGDDVKLNEEQDAAYSDGTLGVWVACPAWVERDQYV